MGLEQIILGLSIVMFVATFYAWRWARRLQRSLDNKFGYDIARLLAWIIGLSLIARIVGTVAVFVLDRSDLDTALRLSLVAQLFGAFIFVFAAYEVRRISRKVYADVDTSGPEPPGEDDEGIGIQIDQIGADRTVTVDDRHPDTRFGTYSNA